VRAGRQTPSPRHHHRVGIRVPVFGIDPDAHVAFQDVTGRSLDTVANFSNQVCIDTAVIECPIGHRQYLTGMVFVPSDGSFLHAEVLLDAESLLFRRQSHWRTIISWPAIPLNAKRDPLISHDLIVKLIGDTTTATGLKVKAALDTECMKVESRSVTQRSTR
jgi:hypothetical protein